MRTHNANRKREGDRWETVWLRVSRVRRECWLGLEVWRDGPVDIVCVLVKVRQAHHCSVLIVSAPLGSCPPLPRAAVLLFPQEKQPYLLHTHFLAFSAKVWGCHVTPPPYSHFMLSDDIGIHSSAYRKQEIPSSAGSCNLLQIKHVSSSFGTHPATTVSVSLMEGRGCVFRFLVCSAKYRMLRIINIRNAHINLFVMSDECKVSSLLCQLY